MPPTKKSKGNNKKKRKAEPSSEPGDGMQSDPKRVTFDTSPDTVMASGDADASADSAAGVNKDTGNDSNPDSAGVKVASGQDMIEAATKVLKGAGTQAAPAVQAVVSAPSVDTVAPSTLMILFMEDELSGADKAQFDLLQAALATDPSPEAQKDMDEFRLRVAKQQFAAVQDGGSSRGSDDATPSARKRKPPIDMAKLVKKYWHEANMCNPTRDFFWTILGMFGDPLGSAESVDLGLFREFWVSRLNSALNRFAQDKLAQITKLAEEKGYDKEFYPSAADMLKTMAPVLTEAFSIEHMWPYMCTPDGAQSPPPKLFFDYSRKLKKVTWDDIQYTLFDPEAWSSFCTIPLLDAKKPDPFRKAFFTFNREYIENDFTGALMTRAVAETFYVLLVERYNQFAKHSDINLAAELLNGAARKQRAAMIKKLKPTVTSVASAPADPTHLN